MSKRSLTVLGKSDPPQFSYVQLLSQLSDDDLLLRSPISANCMAISEFWFNHNAKASWQVSGQCPMLHGWINALWFGENCGSLELQRQNIVHTIPNIFSLISFILRGSKLRSSQNSRIASVTPAYSIHMGSALRRWKSNSHNFLDTIHRHLHSNKWQIRHWHAGHLLCRHKGWMRQNLTIFNFIHQIIDYT